MRVSVKVAAGVLALGAVVGSSGAAVAVERPAVVSGPARGGSTDSAVDRVADFYGAYIDAVDDGTDKLPSELRAHYLTGDLRKRLAAWEKKNHADGVLRAQDVPRAWSVRYHDSGAGHAFTTVTLTWGSVKHPTYTRLAVQSDLASKQISDIKAG